MIFISHACADKPLVSGLMEMIQRGAGLHVNDFCFTSGDGTGPPAGSNFVEHIRSEMGDSTFVVAVITPAFRESEFCLAELGAVWISADKDFYPLCAPSVDREELKATLTGVQVERLDERTALIDLLQRVCDHVGSAYNAPACDVLVSTFLATLPTHLEALAKPTKVPAAEIEQAGAAIASLSDQLTAARDETAELHRRFDELKAAKTADEIAAAVLPAGLAQRVEKLRRTLRRATVTLPEAVADAVPFHLGGSAIPWPEGLTSDAEAMQRAIADGYLTDSDGYVELNLGWRDTAETVSVAKQLQDCLQALDPAERDWFTQKYGVPPDLTQREAFRRLTGVRG